MMKKGFLIEKIKPIDLKDIQGLTYEIFKEETMKQITISCRPRGVEMGNHFHKGELKSRNPEKDFILFGEGILFIHDWRESEINGKYEVQAGDLITINAGVYHSLIVRQEIVLLERLWEIYDPLNCDTYRGLKEYRKYIEPDKTLTRRFEGYLITEPDKKTTIEMLEALKKGYEDYHGFDR